MITTTQKTTSEESDDSAALCVPPVAHRNDAEVDIEILRLIPKRFEINDEKTANWLVRRIIEARQYGEHVREWVAIEQRRCEREEQTLMFLFGRQLKAWAQAQIEQNGGRRKSVGLPAGTVGFRKVNASLAVDDEAAVIQWAKMNLPAAVVTVEKLSRSLLVDHFRQSGELPDAGVHVEPERESFSIR